MSGKPEQPRGQTGEQSGKHPATHPATNRVRSYFLFSTLAIAMSMLPIPYSNAAGFRIPESSIAGLGLSNALVANNEVPGALAYNPAAMSFHEGTKLIAGLTYITLDLSVTSSGGSPTEQTGNDNYLMPNLYAMDQISSDWRWGFAINTPFGLETNWPADTFPAFGGIDQLETGLTKLEMLNYSPNVAWRVNNDLSIALGLNYYDIREANLNSQTVNIGGKGHHHGWTIALLQEAGAIDFGLTYRTAVNVHLEGTMNATPINSEIELPSLMQAGIRWAVNDKLALEFDIERTGWRSMQSIIIRSQATGSILTSSQHNWENADALRLGASYQLNDHTQLRFGYSRDETPVKGGALFSARTPDADRHSLSLGAAYELGGWEIEVGYTYVRLDDQNVNSLTSYTPGSDPNGTNVYNGEYKADGHMLGLGMVNTF